MQIIRLNEDRLNQLIGEMLNEMSWQTYSNAADKREKKGDENLNLFSKQGGPTSDYEKKLGKKMYGKSKELRSASINQWRKENSGDKFDYDADVKKLRNGGYTYEKGKGWKETGVQEEARKHFHMLIEQILNEKYPFYEDDMMPKVPKVSTFAEIANMYGAEETLKFVDKCFPYYDTLKSFKEHTLFNRANELYQKRKIKYQPVQSAFGETSLRNIATYYISPKIVINLLDKSCSNNNDGYSNYAQDTLTAYYTQQINSNNKLPQIKKMISSNRSKTSNKKSKKATKQPKTPPSKTDREYVPKYLWKYLETSPHNIQKIGKEMRANAERLLAQYGNNPQYKKQVEKANQQKMDGNILLVHANALISAQNAQRQRMGESMLRKRRLSEAIKRVLRDFIREQRLR